MKLYLSIYLAAMESQLADTIKLSGRIALRFQFSLNEHILSITHDVYPATDVLTKLEALKKDLSDSALDHGSQSQSLEQSQTTLGRW